MLYSVQAYIRFYFYHDRQDMTHNPYSYSYSLCSLITLITQKHYDGVTSILVGQAPPSDSRTSFVWPDTPDSHTCVS